MGTDPINAPGSHGKAIFVASLVFPPISLFFLGLRLYCRTKLAKNVLRSKFGWDDVSAIITFVFIVIFAVLLALAAHHGFGLHLWQITQEESVTFLKYITVFSPFYLLAVSGYKTTLLLLYWRLFQSRKEYKRLCAFGLFIVLGIALSNLLVTFLGCRPLDKNWYPDKPGVCINRYRVNAAYAALYVVTDFYVALLPMPIIWRMQMQTKRKWRLSAILGIGIIAFFCALIRTITLTIDQRAEDKPYFAAGSPIWSMAEVNVGLWTSCFPAFGPLFPTTPDPSVVRAYPKATNLSSGKRGSMPLQELGAQPGFSQRDNSSTQSILGDIQSETVRLERVPDQKGPVVVEIK